MLEEAAQRPRRDVSVLGFLVFNAMLGFTYNGVLGPFLPAIAHTLRVPVVDAAWLAAATSLGWTVAAAKAPTFVGRFGTKSVILLGLAGMAVTMVLSSMLPSLSALMVDRFIGGLSGGLMGPAGNVYLIERVPTHERGRAFGWVSTGFALGGAVLVPILVLSSSWWGWQGSFVADGLLMALALGTAGFFLPQGTRPLRKAGEVEPLGWSDTPLTLLAANFAERTGYAIMMTFWPALFILRYHAAVGLVAGITGAMYLTGALGSIAGGTLVGRRRAREKPLYLGGVGVGGLILVLLFAVDALPAWVYVLGGCAYAFTDMIARPGYFQLVSSGSASYRRTMGWFAVSNQLGSVTGNLGMPILVAMSGYFSLGWAGLFLSSMAIGLVAASGRRRLGLGRS